MVIRRAFIIPTADSNLTMYCRHISNKNRDSDKNYELNNLTFFDFHSLIYRIVKGEHDKDDVVGLF